MRKAINILMLALCMACLCFSVHAQQAEEAPEALTDYTNLESVGFLFDGKYMEGEDVPAGTEFTFTREGGVGSLYVIYDGEFAPGVLTNGDTGETAVWGREGFLHTYLDLEEIFGTCPETVTLTLGEEDTRLSEIRVFGPGEPPAEVQQWKAGPEGNVDLMVFSAHGDDEQLFFAGVLPDYAGQRGYETMVVYLTCHLNNAGYVRCHEMLDGLWAVGVTNYPVMGTYPDYYSNSLYTAYARYENFGVQKEEVLGYVVEQLRRYHPLVALGHDAEGEYGHGMHRMFSQLLQEAVEISMDPEQYPESAEKWGLWDVPKTYLHQYPQRPIHMNWDLPLERFNGLTAYEVTKTIGFPAHVSQYWDFAWYTAGFETAEEVPEHGPCDYGLYRTTVGEDVEKNDFFENVISHAEQNRLEQERLEAEEEERLALEESRREEQALQEQESQEASREAEALMAEEKAQEAAAQRSRRIVILVTVLAISLIFSLIALVFLRKHRNKNSK